jgi:hypothetical protein
MQDVPDLLAEPQGDEKRAIGWTSRLGIVAHQACLGTRDFFGELRADVIGNQPEKVVWTLHREGTVPGGSNH